MVKNIKDRLEIIEYSIQARQGITSIVLFEYLDEQKYEIIYFNNKCKEVLTYTDLDSFYTDYGINPKDKKTYILKLQVVPNRAIDNIWCLVIKKIDDIFKRVDKLNLKGLQLVLDMITDLESDTPNLYHKIKILDRYNNVVNDKLVYLPTLAEKGKYDTDTEIV